MTALATQKGSKILINQSENSILKVYIQPCNEKQELNYVENFEGNIKEILVRSQEILVGLKKLFPKGDFSIKIEDLQCTQLRFVDSENLYDENFNKVISLNQILQ
ncbi:MAG: hypothetical protein EAZ08_06500 [Cytophagales bacterium]|nr:MAG: hypothetical protein EAZ08_06500 [Cytophagales bacterium]